MAAITPDTGHGIAITFGSSFCTRLLSVRHDGISRPFYPSTTLSTTGGQTFEASPNYDPGTLRGTMQWDTDSSPPLTSAAEAVTVTWGDSESMSGSGFLTEFSISADENVMTADFAIKFTGTITF